jgi:hypothetical protein
MTEAKGPAWLDKATATIRTSIDERVRYCREQWGDPEKPLLADAHALLDDRFVLDILQRNAIHRGSDHALLWMLRQEVKHRLSTGELTAEGLLDPLGPPVAISRDRWPLFEIDFDKSTASLAGAEIAGIHVWGQSAATGAPLLAPAEPSDESAETPIQRRTRTERALTEWARRYYAAEKAAGRKVSQLQLAKDANAALSPLKVTRRMARNESRRQGALMPGEKVGRR